MEASIYHNVKRYSNMEAVACKSTQYKLGKVGSRKKVLHLHSFFTISADIYRLLYFCCSWELCIRLNLVIIMEMWYSHGNVILRGQVRRNIMTNWMKHWLWRLLYSIRCKKTCVDVFKGCWGVGEPLTLYNKRIMCDLCTGH